jgi:hypothetical protein
VFEVDCCLKVALVPLDQLECLYNWDVALPKWYRSTIVLTVVYVDVSHMLVILRQEWNPKCLGTCLPLAAKFKRRSSHCESASDRGTALMSAIGTSGPRRLQISDMRVSTKPLARRTQMRSCL